MKRNALIRGAVLLVMIAGMTLASCKKSSTAQEDIVGTWTAGATSMNVMVGSETLTQYFTTVMGLTADQAALYVTTVEQALKQSFTGTIQIKSNNTYTSTLGGKTDTGTWSLNSDKSKLTIDSSTDDPVTVDVIQLTSSVLHLAMTENTSEDLNSDGTPETITVQADVTFNK